MLFIKSKIQFFESKSQHKRADYERALELFIKSKIQFFESKSQPICTRCHLNYVVYQVKDTIF